MSTTPRRAAPRGHDGDAHGRGGYGAAGMARRDTMLRGEYVASGRMEAR
jgi:hypothetical protein